MIAVVLLCAAFAFGMTWWRVGLLAMVAFAPQAAVVVVAASLWRTKSSDDNRSAMFCAGVASELRAGAVLRHALWYSARSLGCEAPAIDSPVSELAHDLAALFPDIRRELELTIVTVARSGSAAARVFDELGSLALAQSEIRREVKIARAPGRATALVFIVAPLLFVSNRVSSGQAAALLASPQQRVVTVLGLGLFLAGLATAGLVAWRA